MKQPANHHNTTIFKVALDAYENDQAKYIALGRQVCTQAVPQLRRAKRVDEAGKRKLRQRIHLN